MSSIRMDFESVAAETGRLADVVDDMEARVRSAASSVGDLTGGGWTGPAAAAFGAAFAEWDEAATDCVAVLDRLVAGLRGTLSDFVAREQSNAETSRGLTGETRSLGIVGMLGGE